MEERCNGSMRMCVIDTWKKETIIGSMYVEEIIMEERKNWNMGKRNQCELTHVGFQYVFSA
jgi:hypothetical protein